MKHSNKSLIACICTMYIKLVIFNYLHDEIFGDSLSNKKRNRSKKAE